MNSSKLLAAAAAISVIGAATLAYAQTTPTTPAQSPSTTQSSPDTMPAQTTPMTPVSPRSTDGSTTGSTRMGTDGATGNARTNNGAGVMPSDTMTKRSTTDRDAAYGERAARADRN